MENAFGQPQNVVVFGGSSEIARAITKKLSAARADTIVLAGRNPALLSEVEDEARRWGATKVDTVHFDAEEPQHAAAIVREAFEKMGKPVDLVVIAVGLLGSQARDENDAEAVTRLISVNFTWPGAALAEIRQLLVNQGMGRVLVISSIAAVRSRRSLYLYSSAKAGLDRMCLGIAESLEGSGVTMQILRPGVVRTRMSAGLKEPPFTTTADEVAENVMRALATDKVVVWSPPILRYVALVLQCLPTSIWRRVSKRA